MTEGGRKRTLSEHVVLEVLGDGKYQLVARNLRSTADVRRWLKRNTAEDEQRQYQPGKFIGQPIWVKVEIIHKRSLLPGSAPEAPAVPEGKPDE